MSKLFDSVQKTAVVPASSPADNSDSRKSNGNHSQAMAVEIPGDPNLKFQELLETIKGPEPAPEFVNIGLEDCRRVELIASNEILTVVDQDGFNPLATDAYRMLRTRLLKLQRSQELHSVVVTSTARDDGKTLTTMNLALCLSQLPNPRILVVDADLRTGGLSRYLGSPEGPGLAQILSNEAEYNQAIVATDIPNLYAVPAGNSSQPPGELLAGPQLKAFLAWSRQYFNLVLVDSPPVLLLADFELIAAACDGVLLVVRALATQREQLKKVAGQIERKKLVGAVLNAAAHTASRYRDYKRYTEKQREPQPQPKSA